MRHSAECLNHQMDRETKREAWFARWPNHCTACQGAGYIRPSWEPPPRKEYVELCERCAGHCPRCGSKQPQWGDVSDVPCAVCGWNWGKGADDVLLAPRECYGECLPYDDPNDKEWG